ncbi:ATP-binding protein [Bradyrhizobium sp. AT1]|uniref:sce7725 family protein n=1 Tax=Bradyrhizobium sp. AT1 TaxID=574934 RepID=UPI0007969698|nr:sce7725 family protein [Bradyrhizobium sp. AT1]KYG21948.1 ATP-binding protein [Bradyrhizobium sp. AT1]
MYFPYLRGKQYELLTVRETAPILAASNFVPIIEPVKQALGGLERSLDAVCEASGRAVVIVNPYHGDHSSGDGISDLLNDSYANKVGIETGVLLKDDTSAAMVADLVSKHDKQCTLIHAGFTNAKSLADVFGDDLFNMRHVFFEDFCGKLYRKHFSGSKRVLLRDGFERRRNRDHPFVESFSDLHVTFAEEGMNGFGDFLIAGDDYTEGGGPAYAVAIHLTFIDPDQDNEMFIYHFKSISQNTPTDPAGKFAQALAAMIAKLDSGTSKVLETEAVKEFRELFAKKHFPGLGYVKKLSMKHHIETLAAFFN